MTEIKRSPARSMVSRFLDRVPVRVRWNLLKRRYGGAEAARRMGMQVGADCRILSCQVSSEPWLVRIGDGVTVSSDVLFITHDGAGWLFRSAKSEDRPFRYARIEVGDHSFIGARSVLMPGVRVGERSIVAAGTVVHRSVPDGTIVGGNPARVIGSTDVYETKVRATWRTKRDQRGDSYRARVDSIVDEGFLRELT